MIRYAKRLVATSAAAFATLLAAGGPADSAPRPQDLWATVNICDTPAHPNEMGVRASMPGNGTRQHMFMRFHAQFYDATTKKWPDVGGIGVSRWVYAGSAHFKVRQAGWTFSFKQPKPGGAYVLRGVVDFQWRERRRLPGGRLRNVVVRTAHANTKGTHPSDTADPPGYSSGTCEIR